MDAPENRTADVVAHGDGNDDIPGQAARGPSLRPVDVATARSLVDAQFPRWAELPLTSVDSRGTDHLIYRLGDDLAVRFPRFGRARGQAHKEEAWLPYLAPYLPLAVPTQVAKGRPTDSYPRHWSVVRWLAGVPATVDALDDEVEAAATVGEVIDAFHRIPADGAPRAAGQRRQPLVSFDTGMRAAIASAEGLIDTGILTEIWEAALNAPAWQGDPVWIHGDLHPGNLLAHQGRLHGIIDFGAAGLADPAAELSVVWSGVFLSSRAIDRFREAVPLDDATWARGRGWGLLKTPMNPIALAEDVPAGCRPRLEGIIADYQRRP